MRLAKGGREVWLQASYNPMFDKSGRLYKVIKLATDITATEQEHLRRSAERNTAREQQVFAVEATATALSKLAAGDLTYRLDGHFPEEYQRLQADFNAAINRLHEVMGNVAGAAGAIRSGTGEITSAADDLSRRTERQAANLEETAAALDEITATVRKTAEGAREAQGVVNAARGDAEASGAVVADAISAMGKIEASATQISQIVGVIDEIAFQTNLLALNAGVEAARAGAGGRGRSRLRGRRLRGPGPRPAVGRGGQGDQGADLGLDGPGEFRRRSGRQDRPGAAAHRRRGRQDH